MTEHVSEERAAELGRALAEEDAIDQFTPVAVPAILHLINGKIFIVDDVQAWGYVPQGIFATGRFKGYSEERNLLISEQRIDYIELDYTRLRKLFDAQNGNTAGASLILPEEAQNDNGTAGPGA